jgi:hypothetical protein
MSKDMRDPMRANVGFAANMLKRNPGPNQISFDEFQRLVKYMLKWSAAYA